MNFLWSKLFFLVFCGEDNIEYEGIEQDQITVHSACECNTKCNKYENKSYKNKKCEAWTYYRKPVKAKDSNTTYNCGLKEISGNAVKHFDNVYVSGTRTGKYTYKIHINDQSNININILLHQGRNHYKKRIIIRLISF